MKSLKPYSTIHKRVNIVSREGGERERDCPSPSEKRNSLKRRQSAMPSASPHSWETCLFFSIANCVERGSTCRFSSPKRPSVCGEGDKQGELGTELPHSLFQITPFLNQNAMLRLSKVGFKFLLSHANSLGSDTHKITPSLSHIT